MRPLVGDTETSVKTCPACAEINKDEAVACKQCGNGFGPVGPSRLPAFVPRSHQPEKPAPDPATRRRVAGWRRAAGVLVLVALAVLATLALLPAAPRAPAAATGASPTPSGPLHVTASGQGNGSTELFQAPDDWQVTWRFDCRGVTPDGSGTFVASVRDADKRLVGSVLVDQSGPGDGSIAHVRGGGSRYVQIESSCAWDVDVASS